MTAATDSPLPRRLVALLAIATGAVVMNLYYVQPLLNMVGGAFGVSHAVAGLLVTFAQVGYVAGLALLVPLGDIVERRGLISTTLLATALAAAACAAAPTFPVLAAALVALGALSVVAQILVPLSASLAAPHERGQVVGTVMSGLLVGILLARTLSGLVAAVGGWRLVFALAAGGMVVLSLVLRRALPHAPPPERVRYGDALRSVIALVREEPVLRQRMAMGATHMVGFSLLWTALPFLLGGSPYGYGEAVIGLFGLAGVGGALLAPLAGRLTDRGHGQLAVTLSLVTIAVSWGPLALGHGSVVALLAGLVVIDLGVQGSQVSNQSAIYKLRPEARSRLATAYIICIFLGGVVGSAIAGVVYTAGGWGATCITGAAVAVAELALWFATRRVGTGQAAAARRDHAAEASPLGPT